MIGTGRMDNRIAAVTYSALTYMEFTFNDGTDLYNVEQLIDSIKYRWGNDIFKTVKHYLR